MLQILYASVARTGVTHSAFDPAPRVIRQHGYKPAHSATREYSPFGALLGEFPDFNAFESYGERNDVLAFLQDVPYSRPKRQP